MRHRPVSSLRRLCLSLAVVSAAVVSTGVGVPAVAQAAAPVRTSAPMEAESELGGTLPLSVIIVLLTVLGGAIFILTDDDSPDSP